MPAHVRRHRRRRRRRGQPRPHWQMPNAAAIVPDMAQVSLIDMGGHYQLANGGRPPPPDEGVSIARHSGLVLITGDRSWHAIGRDWRFTRPTIVSRSESGPHQTGSAGTALICPTCIVGQRLPACRHVCHQSHGFGFSVAATARRTSTRPIYHHLPAHWSAANNKQRARRARSFCRLRRDRPTSRR